LYVNITTYVNKPDNAFAGIIEYYYYYQWSLFL